MLHEAAKRGGEVLLSYYHKELHVSNKTSHQSLLTQADLHSQEEIVKYITSTMIKKGVEKEDFGFIGEENLSTSNTVPHLFIVDPLDGTNNFASGTDYFGVSIAYLFKNELQSGVIHRPTKNMFFTAKKGQGAYKIFNGETRRLSIRHTLIKDSLILSYISSNAKAREQWFDAVELLNVKTRGTRIIGSCVLDMTLFSDPRNNGNICLNSHTYLWDIAAAKLIVDEAGGALTDWQGNPIELHTENSSITYQVLVCHPDNLKEIVEIINP